MYGIFHTETRKNMPWSLPCAVGVDDATFYEVEFEFWKCRDKNQNLAPLVQHQLQSMLYYARQLCSRAFWYFILRLCMIFGLQNVRRIWSWFFLPRVFVLVAASWRNGQALVPFPWTAGIFPKMKKHNQPKMLPEKNWFFKFTKIIHNFNISKIMIFEILKLWWSRINFLAVFWLSWIWHFSDNFEK